MQQSKSSSDAQLSHELIEAIDKNDIGTINRLLQHDRIANFINLQTTDGQTALMFAAIKTDNYTIVDQLLAKGADPRMQDSNGTTALMFAIIYECGRIVIRFLEDDQVIHFINLQDKYGQTALIRANTIINDNTNIIVNQLLAKGADPRVQDKEGWTALMFAITNFKSEDGSDGMGGGNSAAKSTTAAAAQGGKEGDGGGGSSTGKGGGGGGSSISAAAPPSTKASTKSTTAASAAAAQGGGGGGGGKRG